MNILAVLLSIFAGFSDPVIPDGERLIYQGYDAGNQTSREIVHVVHDKGNYYYSEHEHIDSTQIKVRYWIRKQDFSTIKIIKNRSGRLQLTVEQVPSGIKVTDGFKNKESNLKYSGRFYDRHSLFDVFRAYPFNKPVDMEFPLFESTLGTLITGTCTYGGIHKIKTKLGTFRCYKITLGFKNNLLAAVYKMLTADRSFDFYYELAKPHRMIYWTDNKKSYMELKRIESEGK